MMNPGDREDRLINFAVRVVNVVDLTSQISNYQSTPLIGDNSLTLDTDQNVSPRRLKPRTREHDGKRIGSSVAARVRHG